MKKLTNLLRKYEEIIRYLIIGVCTTVVSLITYFVFCDLMHLHYQVSNLLSWVCSVVFAYFTNKSFVFRTPYINVEKTAKEIVGFVSSRISSLVVEMVCMMVGVQVFGINDGIMKFVDQVIVIIMNYVLSKFLVFKKED